MYFWFWNKEQKIKREGKMSKQHLEQRREGVGGCKHHLDIHPVECLPRRCNSLLLKATRTCTNVSKDFWAFSTAHFTSMTHLTRLKRVPIRALKSGKVPGKKKASPVASMFWVGIRLNNNTFGSLGKFKTSHKNLSFWVGIDSLTCAVCTHMFDKDGLKCWWLPVSWKTTTF